MQKLTMFGMPVLFDEKTDKLSAGNPKISWEDYSRKYSDKMAGLLGDPDYHKTDDPYYDFYKAIVEDDVRQKFSLRNMRYDSTVIMKGFGGNEFKKTSGHFHCLVPGKKVSYPEYYQVVRGTALFVMQKVDDENAARMKVNDLMLAEVKAGEAIVVPPGYGHCTVNISDETMVFINLISCGSQNNYGGVKSHVGMSVYIMRSDDGPYRIVKNSHYDFSCEPKIVTPIDSDSLGIHLNVPVYTEYLKDPSIFDYLSDPEEKIPDMMSVFKVKKDISK